jgi:GntR family transcriptional regulator / MocR family aminotransferase
MAKRAGGLMPVLAMDSADPAPMFLQIYKGIREAILEGRLHRGTRLPSTRSISTELSVSRNTVITAFEQLVAEGYLQGRIGSGTWVTEAIAEKFSPVINFADGTRRGQSNARLSNKIKALDSVPTRISPIGGGHPKPFRVGTPALSEFPLALWQRTESQCVSKINADILDYGDSTGHPWLRHAVAEYVKIARGVNCKPEQVIITTGSQQAIDLLSRVLLNEGDPVWIEDPGYLGARGAFVAAGANVLPVPMDDEGMVIQAGIRMHRKASLIYVSPSHQLPLGITMSLSRRLELLHWAARNNAWIVEDDYDSEFRYRQYPLRSLQGLDENQKVLYMGTFSKVLFPGLRLAYLVVPSTLLDGFRKLQHFSIGHPPVLPQLTLAEFMKAGHFERHIRKMRVLYRERQEILIRAAREKLEGLLDLVPCDTGMHVVGWLPKASSDRRASLRAAHAGIEAIPLSAFSMSKRCRPALLLGYAAFPKKKIEEGVEKLRLALERRF